MIFFHIHIPKTAGTALRESLKRALPTSAVLEWYPPNPYDLKSNIADLSTRILANPAIRLITGHFIYGVHNALSTDSFKYVTILRDPISRLLSNYIHDIHHNLTHIREDIVHLLLAETTIVPYVSNPKVSFFYNNLQSRFISGISQGTWSPDDVDRVFGICKDNVERDFLHVGTQETLETDAQIIFSLMGLPAPEMREENSRGRVDPKAIFSSAELDHLKYLNAVDYRLVRHFARSATITDEASETGLTEGEAVARRNQLLNDAYRTAVKNLVAQNKRLRQLRRQLDK